MTCEQCRAFVAIEHDPATTSITELVAMVKHMKACSACSAHVDAIYDALPPEEQKRRAQVGEQFCVPCWKAMATDPELQ